MRKKLLIEFYLQLLAINHTYLNYKTFTKIYEHCQSEKPNKRFVVREKLQRSNIIDGERIYTEMAEKLVIYIRIQFIPTGCLASHVLGNPMITKFNNF